MLTKGNIRKSRFLTPKVPDYLVYDLIEGHPFYRRGYRDVLSNRKTLEEIMGSSSLQAEILDYLKEILYTQIGRLRYRFHSNEAGIHIANKTNLSGNLNIYEKTVLSADKISKNYADVPPKVAVEVDISIELEKEEQMKYISLKTNKLLQFGTEKVIWILTESRKVIVADSPDNWHILDWNKDIELLEGYTFNIGKYLTDEGIHF
ncbi:MAG: Uma2 family endonuclease [Spirosomataceae bacterium]